MTRRCGAVEKGKRDMVGERGVGRKRLGQELCERGNGEIVGRQMGWAIGVSKRHYLVFGYQARLTN